MTEFTIIATLVAIVAMSGIAVVASRAYRARIESEEKIQKLEQRLTQELQLAAHERDSLLDALDDVFIIVDESDHISYANVAANHFFNTLKLKGRHIRETFLDTRLAEAINECLKSHEPHQTHATFPIKNASNEDDATRKYQTWVINSAPMIAHDGLSPATRIVMRDVTKEHQTEQIRKDFVANASHELRTPMAIINGYLENLLDDGMLEDPKMSRRFLEIMRKHSDRISRIVEEMLIISRLESGKENGLSLNDFGLRDCINDILERLESMIRNQQANVSIQLSSDDITIHGDRFYWTQVLFNLVENALKQNPRPGLKVVVGASETDTHQNIWVSDDGVGIPSADLEHIFRRFYRVDKQHSQQEIKGTGLGLSIVKRAIEAHGGSISVTSIPGQETKFLIDVPKPTSLG